MLSDYVSHVWLRLCVLMSLFSFGYFSFFILAEEVVSVLVELAGMEQRKACTTKHAHKNPHKHLVRDQKTDFNESFSPLSRIQFAKPHFLCVIDHVVVNVSTILFMACL